MTAFYDRQFDVLLSTTIVESGLDIPTANTLIVHRADMFGLGQLYQLRGRVGRSKTRAYALFTIPPNQKLTPTAEKRLKVLQSLDSLGAGFTLASHDLDIRGSGNLLGEEQSGHIREVGFELYQQMLEEAIASLARGRCRGALRAMVAADQCRQRRADPGKLRLRPAGAARPLPPALDAHRARRYRSLRRRAAGPLRSAAGGGQAPACRRPDQGLLPQGRHRPDRGGAERRGAQLPGQQFRQPGGSGLLSSTRTTSW